MNEDIGNTSSSGNIQGFDNPSPRIEPNDRFAGNAVFDVDTDTFLKTFLPKEKYKRWKKYLGVENFSELGETIRTFAKKKPMDGIIVRDEKTGAMRQIRPKKGRR